MPHATTTIYSEHGCGAPDVSYIICECLYIFCFSLQRKEENAEVFWREREEGKLNEPKTGITSNEEKWANATSKH